MNAIDTMATLVIDATEHLAGAIPAFHRALPKTLTDAQLAEVYYASATLLDGLTTMAKTITGLYAIMDAGADKAGNASAASRE